MKRRIVALVLAGVMVLQNSSVTAIAEADLFTIDDEFELSEDEEADFDTNLINFDTDIDLEDNDLGITSEMDETLGIFNEGIMDGLDEKP